MESVIDIRHLRKSFGAHEVLKDIDFSVGKGEVACIIGSSGSGKSTLLRCINPAGDTGRRRDTLPRQERAFGRCVSGQLPRPRGHGVSAVQPL